MFYIQEQEEEQVDKHSAFQFAKPGTNPFAFCNQKNDSQWMPGHGKSPLTVEKPIFGALTPQAKSWEPKAVETPSEAKPVFKTDTVEFRPTTSAAFAPAQSSSATAFTPTFASSAFTPSSLAANSFVPSPPSQPFYSAAPVTPQLNQNAVNMPLPGQTAMPMQGCQTTELQQQIYNELVDQLGHNKARRKARAIVIHEYMRNCRSQSGQQLNQVEYGKSG